MEKNKKALTILILIIFGVLTLGLVGCKNAKGAPQQLSESKFAYTYGVFLSVDNTNLSRFDDFETIVIDAEYFDKEDISKLKKDGHMVYSYINIGSIETFRPFYDRFVGITLGAYANWDEERWVDVSKTEWQNFVTGEIATGYVDKGIDGFFVDNCDVYYNFAKSEIFEGVGKILKKLVATGKKVVVNGGDCFVTEYLQKLGNVGDVLTGVNQESVFGKINFDSKTFGKADENAKKYFQNYVQTVAENGAEVFLLEYCTKQNFAETIISYCDNNNYKCYISNSIELK